MLQDNNPLVDFTMDISLQSLLFEWLDEETNKFKKENNLNQDKNYMLIFVGGSGSGKSFNEKEAVNRGFEKLISHTTRDIRVKDGEIDGVDYFYMTHEKFDKITMIESIEIHGNKYGLAKQELIAKEGDVSFVSEPNGAKQILQFIKDNNLTYIPIVILLDIDIETRRKNMMNRGDDIVAINKRLEDEDLVELFHSMGLEADITITEMCNSMDKVLEYIANIESMDK